MLPLRIVPIVLAVVLLGTGCSDHPPLQTVAQVDIQRFMGTWYEIARYPESFEEGCSNVMVEYTLRGDDRVDVVNYCDDGAGGRDVRGTARVVNPPNNSKLKVSFFWPVEADYWILDLGPNYDYAVIGEPSREHLWVLSREPTLRSPVYDKILSELPARGYSPGRLIRTPQGLPKPMEY